MTPRPSSKVAIIFVEIRKRHCMFTKEIYFIGRRVVRDQDYVDITLGLHLNIKTVFTGMAIPIMNIRRSSDHGIFIRVILILVRRPSLYWDGPQIPSDNGARAFFMKTMLPQSACILLHIHRSWNHSRSSWRQCFCDWRIHCWCIFIVPEIKPISMETMFPPIGAYHVVAYSLFLKSLPILMVTMFLRLTHTLLVHIHCSWNYSRSSRRQCFCDWRIPCWCIFIVPEIKPDGMQQQYSIRFFSYLIYLVKWFNHLLNVCWSTFRNIHLGLS